MDLSKRNRKVAIARWSSKLQEENDSIKQDIHSMHLRAAVCGFLAGDGSIQIRKEKTFYHYQLDFFPDDAHMLETYLQFVYYIYGKKISVQKKNSFFAARITSKCIVLDLLKHAHFGIKTWNVPANLTKTKGAKIYWLKAFFSAEGSVSPSRIKIQAVNKSGIVSVSRLLSELSIEHKLYTYIPKNKNHSEVWIIMILRKDARKKFYDMVGFWHSKKEKLLKESLDL